MVLASFGVMRGILMDYICVFSSVGAFNGFTIVVVSVFLVP